MTFQKNPSAIVTFGCTYFSSIGTATGALESTYAFNVFGTIKGAYWSVVFGDVDAHLRNQTSLMTLLPRESSSKVGRFF